MKTRYATLIILPCILEGILFVAAHLFSVSFTTTDLIALAVASSLAGRAIAYLTVFEWLRAPFTQVVSHSSGTGESVEPGPYGGVRRVIGELLSCPICSGMWAAAMLTLFFAVDPVGGRLLIYVMAAASVGSILTRLVELLEWQKCLAWERTGQLNRQNKAEQGVLVERSVQ